MVIQYLRKQRRSEREATIKATTKIQAEKIAAAGARKMVEQGYRIQNSSIKSLYNKQFRIVKAGEKVAAYTASIEEGKVYCSCPFFQENKEFQVCKHILACREAAAENDFADALTAEYESRWY
jgi:predicted nucleic acid-binding Zn finger protein